jgi:cell division septum initiation protein DivIVA
VFSCDLQFDDQQEDYKQQVAQLQEQVAEATSAMAKQATEHMQVSYNCTWTGDVLLLSAKEPAASLCKG